MGSAVWPKAENMYPGSVGDGSDSAPKDDRIAQAQTISIL